jgi:cation diffusion facilitator CzcD-associated flavoprotein CzcO
LKDVVKSFDLAKYFQLNHKVVGALRSSERGQWDIHVENMSNGAKFVDTCDVFINCGGILK